MPCFHPVSAFRSSRCLHPKSGKPILFFREDAVRAWPGYESLQVPCGSCRGCRLERSRQWAIRIMHEASLHAENCFITLTYAPCYLPENGSLVLRDFQLFMKRLRKRFGSKVRFFHCGEYGERFQRPHYHACLFNFSFPADGLNFIRVTDQGHRVYWSEDLARLWPFGTHEIGSLTFESAAYVARYILKKVNGDEAEEHYSSVDEQGNFFRRSSEYVTMSRRPGIASDWYEKFSSDVFPDDFVVIRGGVKCKPPLFYSRKFELTNPEESALLKTVRVDRARANPHNSPKRLKVREVIQSERCKQLKRSYENYGT